MHDITTKVNFFILGSSGKASWKKRSEMPYTCAFMEEVFRYRTLVGLGIQHSTTEDAEVDGFFIPKGTMVKTSIVCYFLRQ